MQSRLAGKEEVSLGCVCLALEDKKGPSLLLYRAFLMSSRAERGIFRCLIIGCHNCQNKAVDPACIGRDLLSQWGIRIKGGII
jgi:hypothetical protein